MLRSSTSRINGIVGKLEDAILELEEAELAAEEEINKDNEKIAKLTRERDVKGAAMTKASKLRNNLSKLFED